MYESVAFRFIAGTEHPRHDLMAHVRKRILRHFETLFVEMRKVARDRDVEIRRRRPR